MQSAKLKSVHKIGDINGDDFEDMAFYYKHAPSHLNGLSIIWGDSYEEQVVSTSAVLQMANTKLLVSFAW